MTQGKQQTFVSLLEDVDVIEIPVIQRDYAQGRALARDVRDNFLLAISRALKMEGAALDLDFIYGSVVNEGLRTLSVLDGQQRLTTLFLLHWYLAALDGELADFRQRWTVPGDGRSRFTYSTRPSAAEFFQALTVNDFAIPSPGDKVGVSNLMVDSKWFFDAWNRDPTVRSCLVMLDAIHDKFASEASLYQTLIQQRPVTFHYLDLHDFGLSDDLYIKMNARGKGLTPFENFKAWIVKRIDGEAWSDEFVLKLDQQWVDFFWTLSGRDGRDSFDQLFLRFFYIAAYFEFCKRVDGYWTLKNADRDWLQRLRDMRGVVPLREFEANGSLRVAELAELKGVLDYLSGEREKTLIDTVQVALSPKAGYDDLLRLYAIVAFVRSPDVQQLDKDDHEVCFQRWSRVTANLIRNSRIDEPSAAVAAVKGLTTLATHAVSLYQMLTEETPTGLGFARDQVEEECQKAALILQDEEWERLLTEAESHWYLQGRVRFLVKLSTAASSSAHKGQFRRYAAAAKIALTPSILDSQEFLLQRALLSLYDFLPTAGGGNHTFCVSNATAYRDRQENWLPVFEDPRFQQLLDAIGDDAPKSLSQIIEARSASGWRALLVSDPGLFKYCGARLIRKSGANVFLLSKLRLSGYFAEARSYALYLELQRQHTAGKLPDVKEIKYLYVYGDAYPSLLVRTDAVYLLSHRDGRWRCVREDQVIVEMPNSITQIATNYS